MSDASHATRFQPGQSGNPAGKKPGTRNRATVLIEEMMESDAEKLARAAIDKALAGDPRAIKECLDRIAPRPRHRGTTIDLPSVDTIEGVAAAQAALIAEAAAGVISSEEAARFTAMLEGQRRTLEALQLEDRVAWLEEQVGVIAP
jgi:hypothetical protein